MRQPRCWPRRAPRALQAAAAGMSKQTRTAHNCPREASTRRRPGKLPASLAVLRGVANPGHASQSLCTPVCVAAALRSPSASARQRWSRRRLSGSARPGRRPACGAATACCCCWSTCRRLLVTLVSMVAGKCVQRVGFVVRVSALGAPGVLGRENKVFELVNEILFDNRACSRASSKLSLSAWRAPPFFRTALGQRTPTVAGRLRHFRSDQPSTNSSLGTKLGCQPITALGLQARRSRSWTLQTLCVSARCAERRGLPVQSAKPLRLP